MHEKATQVITRETAGNGSAPGGRSALTELRVVWRARRACREPSSPHLLAYYTRNQLKMRIMKWYSDTGDTEWWLWSRVIVAEIGCGYCLYHCDWFCRIG